MKCTITSIERTDREGKLPFFTIKATGINGDVTANVLNADGTFNPLSAISTQYNFTKNAFPATEQQVKQFDSLCAQVATGVKIPIMLKNVSIPTDPYYIMNSTTNDFYRVSNGNKRVFNTINLTVFCDENENVVENIDLNVLADNIYQRGLERNLYIPVTPETLNK